MIAEKQEAFLCNTGKDVINTAQETYNLCQEILKMHFFPRR